MSHNENYQQKKTLRHLFIPGFLSFSIEILTAVILLVVINFGAFESSFLRGYPKDLTFTSYSSGLLDGLLTIISQFSIAGPVLTFAMWAIIGMLVYICVFRLLQAIHVVSSSVNQGYRHIRTRHRQGFIYWFNTLDNFFLKVMVIFISLLLLSFATFLIFTFATQQIQLGLEEIWPYNLASLGLGLIATIIGVRLIMISICLIIPRFARWYLT